MANLNNLNIPLNHAARYLNIPRDAPEAHAFPCVLWPPRMYYFFRQPNLASSVLANSLQHRVNLSAITVNNWVFTLCWTDDGGSNQYKYDWKTHFFFILLSGYDPYPEHPGELQLCGFLVRVHSMFSHSRFSVLDKLWSNSTCNNTFLNIKKILYGLRQNLIKKSR